MKEPRLVALKGIVIAENWGKDGRVSALGFAGYDEILYHVADDIMGKRLRQFVRKRLIIDGLLETTANGITIHVKSFLLIR